MKCVACKKEINTVPDKEGQIRCPECHSEFPKQYAEKLGDFEKLREIVSGAVI